MRYRGNRRRRNGRLRLERIEFCHGRGGFLKRCEDRLHTGGISRGGGLWRIWPPFADCRFTRFERRRGGSEARLAGCHLLLCGFAERRFGVRSPNCGWRRQWRDCGRLGWRFKTRRRGHMHHHAAARAGENLPNERRIAHREPGAAGDAGDLEEFHARESKRLRPCRASVPITQV